jgi:hypothetical protein
MSDRIQVFTCYGKFIYERKGDNRYITVDIMIVDDHFYLIYRLCNQIDKI